MRTKDRAFEVKAFDPDTGVFEGYASVFGVKDAYGDVVVKGAFEETLAEDFGPGGSGVPCWWSHNLKDPFSNIGETLAAFEDEHGLFVKVRLDLSTATGNRVRDLLVEKRVKQMSFGYEVREGAFVESEDLGFFYELRKLRLFEVSVTPVGANSETEILSAKDGDAAALTAALRGAWTAVLGAFKAAGVEPPRTEPVDVEPAASGTVTLSGPLTVDGVIAVGDEEPSQTPATAVAGDADEVGDQEPDEVTGQEPAPPVTPQEPDSVTSHESKSRSLARVALALAGITTTTKEDERL